MVAYPVSAGCLEGPDGSAFAGRLDARYGAPDPSTRWNNPTVREWRIERTMVSNGRVRVMGTRQSIEPTKPPADLPQVLHIPASSPRQELPALTSCFAFTEIATA